MAAALFLRNPSAEFTPKVDAPIETLEKYADTESAMVRAE